MIWIGILIGVLVGFILTYAAIMYLAGRVVEGEVERRHREIYEQIQRGHEIMAMNGNMIERIAVALENRR